MHGNFLERIFNPPIVVDPWPPHRVRAGLLFLALAILISRLPTFHEAFERDLMIYMTIADGLLQGRPLYADLWDIKPPGVYWTYALFAKVFGASPLAIFIMGLSCAWLTLWFCYLAGRSIAGSLGGLLAATLWTVISGDLALQANQPNTEAFINVGLSGAFALLLSATPNRRDWGRFIAIGLLSLLASLFKQVSLVTTAMILATYVILAPWIAAPTTDSSWVQRKRALIQSISAGAVIICGWALVAGYFQWQGHFAAFKETLVDHGRSYAGNMGGNVWKFLADPLTYLPKVGGSIFYLWLAWLSIMLATFYLWKERKGQFGLWLAYCLSTIIAISLPGYFYPHYFQLWLPPTAIGAGWLISNSLITGRKLAAGLLIAALLPLIGLRLYQYTIPVEQIALYKYGQGHGPEAMESRQIGLWIHQNIDSKTLVYHWGAEPGIYFWAKRTPPVGMIVTYPLFMGNPEFITRHTEKLLQQLKQSPPGLVVANKAMLIQDHPVVKWLAAHYKISPDFPETERFILLIPR